MVSSSAAHIRRLSSDEVLSLPTALWNNAPCPLDFLKGLDLNTKRMEMLGNCAASGRGFCARAETDLGTVYFLAEHLPWDSEHFGLRTVRVEQILFESAAGVSDDRHRLLRLALPMWNDLLAREGVDYAFGTFDSRHTILLCELSTVGYVPLEVRVNYWRDLSAYGYSRRYKVRLAGESDLDSLETTAALNVNPLDRFHADPILSPVKVDELMRLWARNSVLSGFADGVLVPDMNPPDAFCTFRLHRDKWPKWRVKAAQPVLAAVSGSRSGWYVKIMSELSYHLKNEGADQAFMSTQLGNVAVIRAWQALGYSFGSGEVTMRWVSSET